MHNWSILTEYTRKTGAFHAAHPGHPDKEKEFKKNQILVSRICMVHKGVTMLRFTGTPLPTL
jgi:hypothetical protein